MVVPLHGISVWHDLFDYEAPEQKKFAIIICSCNNKNWYEKNLESAFSQDYPRDKFRIIYVDESRDGTADFVSEYVTAHNQWDRFTLIRNNSWQSVMHNHYKAAHMCDDDEIIVHLDGDDFLKHNLVLNLLNKAYNKWDIWLTYGQYETWPDPAYGFSIDVPHDIAARNEFRDMGFWYSHLRTCYAWLFKSIHLKDLIWQGSFIPTTPAVDYMFMFPMMEMAGDGHYLFIEDVLYLYNRSNSLSTCNMPIKLEIPPARSWEKYEPLQEKNNTITQRFKNKQADLIILCFDDEENIGKFCQEINAIKGLDQKIVLYRQPADLHEKQYHSISTQFKNIRFINIDHLEDGDFISNLTNDHCLIVADCSSMLRNCNISDCIYQMERTFAKAFFLGLSKQNFIPCNTKINYGPFLDGNIEYRLAFLGNGIAAWQFAYERYILEDARIIKSVLLKKSLLKKHTYNLVTNNWNKLLVDITSCGRDIGLLFED
jgi:glycosyltransferase involved in cell wall biosynthesis